MLEFFEFIKTQIVLASVFIILLLLFIINILNTGLKKYKELEVSGFIDKINQGKITLLDIREEKERAYGHIKNDIHIPMAQVKNKISKLNQKKTILVYCRSGQRSSSICQLLAKQGFDAYMLKGGFIAWQNANMPISKQ